MTSTSSSQTTLPPVPEASPRLERTSRYRGVCSALARTTGTDPLLWQVVFIVLAFFDGIGLVLYLAALVVIPERGKPESLGKRLLHGPDRHLEGPDVMILVVLALAAAATHWSSSDGFTFLVFVVFCLLVFSHGGGFAVHIGSGSKGGQVKSGSDPSDGPEAEHSPARTEPLIPPLPAVPAEPADPVRPRSALTALTLGMALLVTGFLVLVDRTTSTSISPEVMIAVALGVVGLGIVVSAWWGRSLVLLPVAILLGVALAVTSVARPAIDAGVGDRSWTPTGSATFRLGIGEATLDLRHVVLPETGATTVTARVDVGHLIVLLPQGARVSVHTAARWGDLLVLGQDVNGHRVTRDARTGPEGAPQVVVDATVRAGQVEVRNG